jgi:large subunit ribosomal protein L19
MHAVKTVLDVESKFLRTDLPVFRTGDTIRVHAKISEGEKSRIQMVEGTVIKKSGKGATKTFTLRKISDGIGVEMIYPYSSPAVTKIEIASAGSVRRSRLYYLRERTGKSAKVKTKDRLATDTKTAGAAAKA